MWEIKCPLSLKKKRKKSTHSFASLTAAGLSLPRRLGRRGAGRLFLLLLQSAGSEWIPALAPLCFRRPGRQQHRSGIWDMVRNGGMDGGWGTLCLSSCMLCSNGGKGRTVGANYQILQPSACQELWGTPCPSPENSCKEIVLGSSFRSGGYSPMMVCIIEILHPSRICSRISILVCLRRSFKKYPSLRWDNLVSSSCIWSGVASLIISTPALSSFLS